MLKKWCLLLMASISMHIFAADTQKTYPRWVQNAAQIYVYSKRGTLYTTMPITNDTTLNDVRSHLIDECVISYSSCYSFCPLYNAWYRLGNWHYSQEELKSGNIKNHMQQQGTSSFWLKRKPRPVRVAEEDNE